MQRIVTSPRPNWQARVEEQGLTFHSADNQPYWHEQAYYRLTSQEVDELEAAASELHLRYLDVAEYVIRENRWQEVGIPAKAVPTIQRSWERDDLTLYGRFDLAYDPRLGPPKLLEYNADTPTGLLEAAIIQWYWMQDCFPHADQFNSLHERLIDAWKRLARKKGVNKVHLTSIEQHPEDAQTVLYLADTCHQAGLDQVRLFIEDIGWNGSRQRFVDLRDQPIDMLFKLYPWEWLWEDAFSEYLPLETCVMVEPAWKMLLSNKGLLPILYELFPNHPNLLPAYFESQAPARLRSFARKPLLSREGANVSIVVDGETISEKQGDYGAEGYIIQALAPTPQYDGYYPVMGVWIINHEPGGLGIREDQGLITGNTSLFTPHIFD